MSFPLTNPLPPAVAEIAARMALPKRRARPRLAPQFSTLEPDIRDGVATWRAGAGPAVLLLHGWEDDHSLWTPLIEPLIEAGFSVVGADLPGHGFSPAACGSTLDCAALVAQAVAAFGPFYCVVAHSYGCPISVLAQREFGLSSDRFVLIAAARAQREQIHRLAARNGLTADEAMLLVEHYESRAGRSIDAFDLADWAKEMTKPALVIHSLDDDACPFEGAEAIAAHWPGGELYLTDQLGHRLVVQDSATIARILQFLG